MNFDFNLILVPLTLIFFFVWLLDKLVLKSYNKKTKLEHDAALATKNVEQAKADLAHLKQQHAVDAPEVLHAQDKLSHAETQLAQAHYQANQQRLHPVVAWAYDFWWILALVLCVRSFLFEPFNIPSESMNPTLQTGDFILVNKYAYGVRLPLTNTKVIDSGSPQHGDVAVFAYPKDPKIKFIKRIIGLPGDKVEIRDGQMYINGQLQPSDFKADSTVIVNTLNENNQIKKLPVAGKQYLTTIGEHQFLAQYLLPQQPDLLAQNYVQSMLIDSHRLSQQQNLSFEVPAGQYFAMGDNRDQSDDGRYWGFIPEDHLTGKATYVWMHKEPGLNIPSFSRNGSIP
ncbi:MULTISPECIES: signal peptidase I [unclassified Acinetobacter]|uniref:signal peptidase I n=1 Tax=unclassified Acinetobacter TaxID=196816 RepID=UPI0035B7C776